MIVIRPAQRGDEPAIAQVRASALGTLREVYRPTPAAIARRHELAPLPRLVAVVGEQLVGTVEYALGEERLHLMGLFVAASHRQTGVARALVEELARLADHRPLSLNTIRETGNVAIFERLGFVIVSEAPARDVIGKTQLHDVLMTR